MDIAAVIIARIERLSKAAFRSAVAQTAHGSVLLQEGLFATEEDFDNELAELKAGIESGKHLAF